VQRHHRNRHPGGGHANEPVGAHSGGMTAPFAIEPDDQAEQRGDAKTQNDLYVEQSEGNGGIELHDDYPACCIAFGFKPAPCGVGWRP